jgi:hypothetical protein
MDLGQAKTLRKHDFIRHLNGHYYRLTSDPKIWKTQPERIEIHVLGLVPYDRGVPDYRIILEPITEEDREWFHKRGLEEWWIDPDLPESITYQRSTRIKVKAIYNKLHQP